MAKEWAWSYSKKKNYDTCPKRHYEVDIQKNFTEESEQLKWGNEVHAALANACKGIAPLPDTMRQYQRFVSEMQDEPGKPGKLLVEQKYAITRDFQPTSYFAGNVWYRGICDALRIQGPVARARDWKTGKVKHDSIQLMLMASCIFIHHPQVQRILTEFVWLQDDCMTPDIFSRDTFRNEWVSLIPEINAMEAASKSLTYPPKPGKLCYKWCPVTSCPYHGKSQRG